ncbi:MAG: 3-isopropylmalate dehydratase small subunit [Rickettsiales bacterium]|nr:3-isopropylmalate dehydratase small subunit [Rickettsiales bacterium]|tara:strand:+ start:2220 stop:2819 length:600 start_codon:yes stop_codon:yes gene_type:complete
MERFNTLEAVAAPLPTNHIDTDVIYPGRFLSTVQRSGLGPLLFHGLRFDERGQERPDFVLNRPAYRQAGILVTGENFGCGSSREHAPWALFDFGIRCILSTGFADIFAGNCVGNGILCVTLPPAKIARLMQDAEQALMLKVNLQEQVIERPCGEVVPFGVPAAIRKRLLSGMDEISMTLQWSKRIDDHERQLTRTLPWL